MNKKEVGESLKEIRELNNKSVYDIEKDIGISHQSLYKWENGEQEPSILKCVALAEYFNVTIDYLIGREVKNDYNKSKYNKCTIIANGNNKL